jgi:hypothetical protein
MSLIHRCGVLQAAEEERNAWLKETVEYMADRYPNLSRMQLAQLEIVGRRFCAPVIEHGAGHTAMTQNEGSEPDGEQEADAVEDTATEETEEREVQVAQLQA